MSFVSISDLVMSLVVMLPVSTRQAGRRWTCKVEVYGSRNVASTFSPYLFFHTFNYIFFPSQLTMRPPLLVSATLIAASNVAGPSTSIHHIAKRAIPSFSLVKPHPHSSSTLRSVRFVSTARPTATENTNNPDPSSPSPTRQIRPQRKPTRSPSRFVSPNSPRRPKPAETETPIKPVPEQKSLWQSYLSKSLSSPLTHLRIEDRTRGMCVDEMQI